MGFEKENYRVRDIGLEVNKIWPTGKLIYLPNSKTDLRDYKVNFDLLNQIFPNFKPDFPIKKGIPDLRNLLEKIAYSVEDREKNRYVRLTELKPKVSSIFK